MEPSISCTRGCCVRAAQDKPGVEGGRIVPLAWARGRGRRLDRQEGETREESLCLCVDVLCVCVAFRDNAGNAASCRVVLSSSLVASPSRCPPSHTTIPYTPPHAQQALQARPSSPPCFLCVGRPGQAQKANNRSSASSSFFLRLLRPPLLPSSLHHKPWRVRRKRSETTSWSFSFSSFWCWWPGRIGSALGPALRRSTLRYGRREGGEVEVDDCGSAPSP